MTSRTASPTSAETGLPPKVLKYSIPPANERAISGVVTTAPSGCPLPIGLPIVTMSGTTPWSSKPQKCTPTRPNPICTSSAMQTPPEARTSSYAAARNPGISSTCPAVPGMGSLIKPPDQSARSVDLREKAADSGDVRPGLGTEDPAVGIR